MDENILGYDIVDCSDNYLIVSYTMIYGIRKVVCCCYSLNEAIRLCDYYMAGLGGKSG